MNARLIYPEIFKHISSLVACQTTRIGSSDTGLYPSFNLGESVGDDISIVKANKETLCQLLGFESKSLAKSKQVHGSEILPVASGGYWEGYDALITNQSNILLAVTIADCVPILLYDVKTKAIAAIHSGWKGTVSNIIGATINKMRLLYDVQPENLIAYIGACISGIKYEVGPEVAFNFDDQFYSSSKNEGKYLLDLKGVCKNQLISAGLLTENVEVSEYCTFQDNDLFYSHRKENGKTGRMLAVIGRHASTNT